MSNYQSVIPYPIWPRNSSWMWLWTRNHLGISYFFSKLCNINNRIICGLSWGGTIMTYFNTALCSTVHLTDKKICAEAAVSFAQCSAYDNNIHRIACNCCRNQNVSYHRGQKVFSTKVSHFNKICIQVINSGLY